MLAQHWLHVFNIGGFVVIKFDSLVDPPDEDDRF